MTEFAKEIGYKYAIVYDDPITLFDFYKLYLDKKIQLNPKSVVILQKINQKHIS